MRIVYLAYEIRSREIIGYQEMAHNLIESDSADYVFVGDKYILQRMALFKLLIRGVFMFKSAQSHLKGKLSKLKDNGFLLFVHDAEAVCDYEKDGHHDCFMKHHDSLEYVNTIFTSLSNETKALKKSNPKLRVAETGYMRFHHLLDRNIFSKIYANESSLLRKKYGNHILIVSSGTSWKFNYDKGFNEFKYIQKIGAEDWHLENLISYANYSHVTLFSLLDFIRMQISQANSNYQIVFRPHPTEDNEFYIRLFSGLRSIYVDNSFSLPASILSSSKVILAPNSTTSFECALLEKESFCLMPDSELYKDKAISDHISSSLSTIVNTPTQLYKKINQLEPNIESFIHSRKQKVKEFVNLSGSTMMLFCKEVDRLFNRRKNINKTDLLLLKLQKLALVKMQYLYKLYLSINFFRSKTSYGLVSNKLSGEILIDDEILSTQFPNTCQEHIGKYLLISKKKIGKKYNTQNKEK